MKISKQFNALLNGPLLDKVKISHGKSLDTSVYPFSLSIIQQTKEFEFPTQVTFFVGENGTGKSTILEAIAYKADFGQDGGSKNIHFKTAAENTYTGAQLLADQLTLSWRMKPRHGYFFRAESFFNVANHIDYLAQIDHAAYAPYGGKSLHAQSHGESFLSFFSNGLGDNGFFILDEPEAALSPQRQLSLLLIIHELCTKSQAQFIIATHSPILLAYQNSTIYSCDSGALARIGYKDTDHYQVTKKFLDDPDRYLYYLLQD